MHPEFSPENVKKRNVDLLMKSVVRVWTEFSWLRIGPSGGL
jgi:hypothetical protein